MGSDTSLDIIYSEDSGDEYIPEKNRRVYVSDSDESLMALEKYPHQPESAIIIANHNDYTIIVSYSTT